MAVEQKGVKMKLNKWFMVLCASGLVIGTGGVAFVIWRLVSGDGMSAPMFAGVCGVGLCLYSGIRGMRRWSARHHVGYNKTEELVQ